MQSLTVPEILIRLELHLMSSCSHVLTAINGLSLSSRTAVRAAVTEHQSTPSDQSNQDPELVPTVHLYSKTFLQNTSS